MQIMFRMMEPIVVVKRYLGSVIPTLKNSGGVTNTTATSTTQKPVEEIASPVIIVVITIVSTVIPFICIIVAIVLARWLWVKYRGGGVSEASGLVDREDTAQSSIKSREGSRKSTRSSRITKGDPNSRDHLIPEDGLTSPVEEALDENGISTVQATALQDDKASEAFVRRASTRRKSMSSVRVDGDTLMPITEAVRHMEAGRRSSMRIDSDQSRYLQEHGKNTLQTEAEIEPVAAHRDEVAIAIEPTSYDHLESRGRITLGEEDAMAASTSSAHSHHSHHTHETSHSHQENKVASKEETETQEKTPEVKEGDIDAIEGQKEHLVEALDSKEDENAKTGLSTSDLSLNSEGGDGDESNPSYSYGNQVGYGSGHYGYPVSQGHSGGERRHHSSVHHSHRSSHSGKQGLNRKASLQVTPSFLPGDIRLHSPHGGNEKDFVDIHKSLPPVSPNKEFRSRSLHAHLTRNDQKKPRSPSPSPRDFRTRSIHIHQRTKEQFDRKPSLPLSPNRAAPGDFRSKSVRVRVDPNKEQVDRKTSMPLSPSPTPGDFRSRSFTDRSRSGSINNGSTFGKQASLPASARQNRYNPRTRHSLRGTPAISASHHPVFHKRNSHKERSHDHHRDHKEHYSDAHHDHHHNIDQMGQSDLQRGDHSTSNTHGESHAHVTSHTHSTSHMHGSHYTHDIAQVDRDVDNQIPKSPRLQARLELQPDHLQGMLSSDPQDELILVPGGPQMLAELHSPRHSIRSHSPRIEQIAFPGHIEDHLNFPDGAT